MRFPIFIDPAIFYGVAGALGGGGGGSNDCGRGGRSHAIPYLWKRLEAAFHSSDKSTFYIFNPAGCGLVVPYLVHFTNKYVMQRHLLQDHKNRVLDAISCGFKTAG